MPCMSGGPTSDELWRGEYDKVKKELDKVTRLLCGVLGTLEEEDKGFSRITDECQWWWEEHQVADRKRRDAEKRAEQQREYEKQLRISQLEAELARLKGQ